MTGSPLLDNAIRLGRFTCPPAQVAALCAKVNEDPGAVYELVRAYGGEPDSVTREAVFEVVAETFHGGVYAAVYDRWLAAPDR